MSKQGGVPEACQNEIGYTIMILSVLFWIKKYMLIE